MGQRNSVVLVSGVAARAHACRSPRAARVGHTVFITLHALTGWEDPSKWALAGGPALPPFMGTFVRGPRRPIVRPGRHTTARSSPIVAVDAGRARPARLAAAACRIRCAAAVRVPRLAPLRRARRSRRWTAFFTSRRARASALRCAPARRVRPCCQTALRSAACGATRGARLPHSARRELPPRLRSPLICSRDRPVLSATVPHRSAAAPWTT